MPRSNFLQKFLTQNPDLEIQIQNILDQKLSELDTKEEIKAILDEKNQLILDFVEESIANPLQILVLALQYDNFKGKMAVGKISSGKIIKGQSVVVISASETIRSKVTTLLVFDGLGLKEVEEAESGEIVIVAGLDKIGIGDTITTVDYSMSLPRVKVDETTIQMTFGVNTSPFAGKEGKLGTSRQIYDYLMQELETNVALRVERHPDSSEKFIVSGRGELHLSVLIESMRRKGFELEVSRPEVIYKTKAEVDQMIAMGQL